MNKNDQDSSSPPATTPYLHCNPKPLYNTRNTPKAGRDEMQMIASIQDTRDSWWAQGKAH